jgi:hypothetical protein
MPDEFVNVRYMVDDVDTAVAFYTIHFGFELRSSAGPAFAVVRWMPPGLARWLVHPCFSRTRSLVRGEQTRVPRRRRRLSVVPSTRLARVRRDGRIGTKARVARWCAT